jgi:hypothetical protein
MSACVASSLCCFTSLVSLNCEGMTLLVLYHVKSTDESRLLMRSGTVMTSEATRVKIWIPANSAPDVWLPVED